MYDKKNLIREKSYEFSLKIIKFYQEQRQKGEIVLLKQLLRSGTSMGANVEEAIAGQTRRDFIAKMSIASKEARETNYWLRLLRDSKLCTEMDLSSLLAESEHLIRILTSIVKTSQQK